MNVDDTSKAVHRLRQLCEESTASGEFADDSYEEIRGICDDLSASDFYDAWANELVRVIEDYDDKVDLSVGYPGDFGHALESGGIEASCKLFIQSLERKPTGLITGLASRAFRSDKSNCGFDLELFRSILVHPNSTASAKEIADMVVDPC